MSEFDYVALWDRVDRTLARFAPLVFGQLRPPATVTQIEKAETEMGIELPRQIREAYLRHNGCPPPWREYPNLPQQDKFLLRYYWCDLDVIAQRWHMMLSELKLSQQLHPDWYVGPEDWWSDLEIKPEGWNAHWIPFGLSHTPDTVYIDLDPGPKGQLGQLISTDGAHDGVSIFAPSLNDYLTLLMDGLETGSITHDGARGFVDKATDQLIMRFWPELQLW
jgi:internalin A